MSGVCLSSRLLARLPAPSQHVCADIRSVGAPQRRAHAPPAARKKRKPGWLAGSKESLRRVPPQQIASMLPRPRPVANEHRTDSLALTNPMRAKARGWDFIPFVSFFFIHFFSLFPDSVFWPAPSPSTFLWMVGRAPNDECGMTSGEQTNSSGWEFPSK